MQDYWLRLLGFDTARIPPDAEVDFIWANAPQSWRIFLLFGLLAVLVYGVFFLYRRETATCPKPARLILGGLRAAVLGLLVVIFMGPSLAISQRRTVQPYVVVLIDESQSMSIADRYLDDASVRPVVAATGRSAESIRAASPTRVRLVEELLAKDDRAVLRQLAERGKLRVFGFSNKINPIEVKIEDPPVPATAPGTAQPAPKDAQPAVLRVGPLPPMKATGQGTLLAKAVREAIKSLSGSTVAAIVLISDGQNTAKDDDPAALAETVAALKVPLFTVGVGDPTKPRNLRVVDMYADEQVWRGDPFEIQAVIAAQGLDEAAVQVELAEQKLTAQGEPTGGRTVVERRAVTLPADGREVSMSFKHKPPQDGLFAYSVSVPVQTGELLESDNARSLRVRVLKEQARVLLVSGAPSWEYRSVQALYKRDPTINLSCWLQTMDEEMSQEGDTEIDRLPRTFEELNRYDLVIMFDPNPAEFNDAWFGVLKRFLAEHAGGFLYMAGPKYSSRVLTEPTMRGLRDVLPVRLGDAGAIEVESLTARYSKTWPLAVLPAALDHPLMRFEPEIQPNQTRWEKMPGIYWSFPALTAKPAARLLIQHSDPSLRRSDGPRPLLVAGQYGAGRTVYMGFNGTWRWRRLGKDSEYFNKYWIQMCRYLIEGKLLVNKRRGTIDSAGDKFAIGDTVKLTARLFDSAFQPLALRTVAAKVRAGTAESALELRAITGKAGEFEASYTPMQLGLHEISVELPDERAGTSVRITRQFEVELPRVEFEDTRLNKALLVNVAEKSGGAYFDINQLTAVSKAIPDRLETLVVAGKPAELWDTDRLLIVLVGLLTLEWAFRKRFKLM